MNISDSDKANVRNRLKRASGQLTAVIRMLDEAEDCSDIVTQLSACSKAIDRAGFALMVCGLQTCMNDECSDETRADNIKRLEKLFLSLA